MSYHWVVGINQENRMKSLSYKCKSYKRYNGLRTPKCSGGKGCRVCWNIYYAKNPSEDCRGEVHGGH
jgi:hypothetical protein